MEIENDFSHLDDEAFIFDLYYQKSNKRSLIPVYTEELSFERQHRKSIVKETKTLTELEEHLTLQDLKTLKKIFQHAIGNKMDTFKEKFPCDIKPKERSLTKEEFTNAFSNIALFQDFSDHEFEMLFDRLDLRELGYINWSDFCNQLIVKYNENECTLDNLSILPFLSKIVIKYSSHNRRDETIKTLFMENPWRFFNVSRRGSIGIWSKTFEFIKSYQISDEVNSPIDQTQPNTYYKSIWITDAVLLKKHHKICLATSRRKLRFFSISVEYFTEEFCIFGLPNNPNCLDYSFIKESNEAYLVCGDTSGSIHVFHFLNPNKSFYDEIHRPVKDALEVHISNLGEHKNFIRYFQLKNVHSSVIRGIQFHSNKSIVSCSSDSKRSIVISDPDQLKKAYVFSLLKGVSCFDFNLEMHLIASASFNSSIYLWNYYSPSKPLSVLRGHLGTVTNLKIDPINHYLYSLSIDSVLKAWDLKKENCIQTIHLEFSSMQIHLDYGPNPLMLYFNNNKGGLIVTCCDYIGVLPIGQNLKLVKQVPVSHSSPISSMVYSDYFRIVITCTESSEIIFWNIVTNKKILSIKNAHEYEEITFCCLDKSQRRLFTAARDGTIKAWNIANGFCIQEFEPIDENEVTGLVVNDKKRIIFSVGWSKKIVSYLNVSYESMPSKPKLLWHGEFQHNDDILSSDSYSTLLATGSYDGQINVWSVETQQLFACLQNSNSHSGSEAKNAPVDKLLFLKHRASNGLNTSVLISSEAGYLKFWRLDLKKSENLCTKFYASAFKDQSVLSLATDSKNRILLSGDTKGFIYVWDIETYAMNSKSLGSKPAIPVCLNSWRAHDSTIISIEYIEKSHMFNEFILSASTDKCCRLWTTNGLYIGSFGQETRWNLNKKQTFQGTNLNISKKSKEQKNETIDIEKTEKNLDDLKLPLIIVKNQDESGINQSKIDAISNKNDPIAGLLPFKMISSKVDYDLKSEKLKTCGQLSLKKMYSKTSLEIDTYTKLPIHEFSGHQREEIIEENFRKMNLKLSKIA